MSAGKYFRQLVSQHSPLIIAGTINALTALMAQQAGLSCIYLSGAGVANASFGLPDLGLTTLDDVLADARRIISVCSLPLLVDIDAGLAKNVQGIKRTIEELERAGVAAVHMEDQVTQKRCGHRPNKKIVTTKEMCERIEMAVSARSDSSFVIMARTDALALESFDVVVERAQSYIAAGADMIFLEAVTDIAQYTDFKAKIDVPLLANITEFGKTPLYNAQQLADAGVDMMLCPLSAFRAMNKAADRVYKQLVQCGTQQKIVDDMQTRDELYQLLNYIEKEQALDE